MLNLTIDEWFLVEKALSAKVVLNETVRKGDSRTAIEKRTEPWRLLRRKVRAHLQEIDPV